MGFRLKTVKNAVDNVIAASTQKIISNTDISLRF
jgi:hypothetical protein